MRRHAATATPPPDWSQTPLGAVADVAFSNVDKKARPREAKVRLCNYLDVYQNDCVDDNHPYMEATATRTEIRKFGLCDGDILITKDSEAPDDIGIPTVVKNVGSDVVCGYHLALIRPRGGISPIFLAKQLRTERLHRYFGKEANGTTRYGLSTASVTGIPLWVPAASEQRRIAEILDTLDEAIRKTEQVIAKVQQMKQGLLHDLLTRGIDDDGELRDPDRHPEQFKDSPLGRIPREWEVGSLRSFYSEPHRNGLYKPNSYHGRGPLMIQMGGIFKGLDADFSGAIRVQVSPIEVRTYGLRQGDLLFARRSLVLEGAGKCSLVRSLPEPATFESSIVRVHVDQQRLRPEFVALYLDSSGSYLQRRKCIRQVAVSGVSGADISAFPVPCPSLGEQDGIVARHRTLCSRLGEEKTELDKVHTLKHGLMDDLLTGRVRVSVPEEAAA